MMRRNRRCDEDILPVAFIQPGNEGERQDFVAAPPTVFAWLKLLLKAMRQFAGIVQPGDQAQPRIKPRQLDHRPQPGQLLDNFHDCQRMLGEGFTGTCQDALDHAWATRS